MMPSVDMIVDVVRRALTEDVGRADVTTQSTIAPEQQATATIVAREPGIVAGIAVAQAVFSEVDRALVFRSLIADGAAAAADAAIAEVTGAAASLLTAERTALNFLQRMSGIATFTRRLVDAVEGTGARILDTRKTAPGLRCLDKWAVALGGGANHRFGLFDGILIKDNHVRLAGGVRPAIAAARAHAPFALKIEVEVESPTQVREALEAGADILLLDNMSIDDMRWAVTLARGHALTEASGRVTLETVRSIAETGVDFISVGALTHSVAALDIALDITD